MSRASRYRNIGQERAYGMQVAQSLAPTPDHHYEDGKAFQSHESLIPMSDLDLMIKMGWGETPRHKIPADWRTSRRKGAVAVTREVAPQG